MSENPKSEMTETLSEAESDEIGFFMMLNRRLPGETMRAIRAAIDAGKLREALRLVREEAERLLAASAPHLRPLLVFRLGTGARLSEAIELDWRDVDLAGRAVCWRTKGGQRRVAHLPSRVVAALANLPHRDGSVFPPTPLRYADALQSGQDRGEIIGRVGRDQSQRAAGKNQSRI